MYDHAATFFFDLIKHCPIGLQHQARQEFAAFQSFCKSSHPWTRDHEIQSCVRFPLIAKFRQRLISSPIVSSSSERGFSVTRRIETGERNRLSEKTTEMLSFIHLNMRSKIRKEELLWKDIEQAIYSHDRSLLDDPSTVPPTNEEEEPEVLEPIIDSSSVEDSNINNLQDELEASMRILQGSPEETDTNCTQINHSLY